MRAPHREQHFQRVVVVLDATSDSARTLQSSAHLASRFDAELLALFVEDRKLLDLEDHPYARAIDLPTGLGHGIGRGSMRRNHRALARRAERMMARLATSRQLEMHFEAITAEGWGRLGERLGSSDLLVVERMERRSFCPRTAVPHSRMLAGRTAVPVLFTGISSALRSLVVIYDGSRLARDGFDVALRIDGHHRALITVVLVAPTDVQAARLREEVATRLGTSAPTRRIHLRRITQSTPQRVANVARSVHAQLLVIPHDGDDLDDEAIAGVTDRIDCPVLVLRGTTGGDEAVRQAISRSGH